MDQYFLDSFIGKYLHQKVFTKGNIVNGYFLLVLFVHRSQVPISLSYSQKYSLFDALLMVETAHLHT